MNYLKTTFLLAALTALFMGMGYLLGGQAGMVMALLFSVAMNVFSWWNSDKLVLRMNGAQPVDEASAPELYRLVAQLARKGGLPVPKFLEKFCDRVPPPEAYRLPRRKRNKQVKVHVKFRQGKGKEVTIPIIMHRLLPEGGYVKRMVLVRREHGKDFSKWFLQLTVEVPPEEFLEKPQKSRKPVAVFEVGFRKVGEAGASLKMPVLENGRWKKVRVLRKADVLRVGVIYDGEKIREVCLR